MANGLVGVVVTLLLGVPLFGLCWHLVNAGLRRDSGILIRRQSNGHVVVQGRIPRAKVFEVKEFCSRNLAGAGSFTVRGVRKPGRTLDLRFTGHLTPGERQRVRNFLVECLG